MAHYSQKWNITITGSAPMENLVKDYEISFEQERHLEDITNKLTLNSKDFFACVGLNEPFILESAMNIADVAVGIAFSEEELWGALEVCPSLRRTKVYIDEKVEGPVFDKVYCNYINKKYLDDCITLIDDNGLLLIANLPNKTCLNDFIKKETKQKIVSTNWFFPNHKNNKRFDLLLKITKCHNKKGKGNVKK